MKLSSSSALILMGLTLTFSLLSVLFINWNPERTSTLGIFFSCISGLPLIFNYATWGYFFVYPILKQRHTSTLKSISKPPYLNLTSLLITYASTIISWTSIYMIFWFQYDNAWKDIDHSLSSPYLAWLSLLATSTYLACGTAPAYGLPNNIITTDFTAMQLMATWVNVLFIITYAVVLWDNRFNKQATPIANKLHVSREKRNK